MKSIVHSYIENPFPVWETRVTEALVQNKWNELKKYQLHDPNEYTTSRFLNKLPTAQVNRFSILNGFENEVIYLETPSFNYLDNFYSEHGLHPCNEIELVSNNALTKLKSAMAVIDLIKPAYSCVTKLVRSVQVLKQEDAEIDVSYSHPVIPFSIFVSVCQDNTAPSNLRVAESMLHESMHLKLTLIENVIQLVKPNTGNVYFSPWRDEKRPAQGILHGLFVFRAILDFYNELSTILDSRIISDFLNIRKEQIGYEISLLKQFQYCFDLTKDGAILSKNLLPLN
jgi:hypothetical protein